MRAALILIVVSSAARAADAPSYTRDIAPLFDTRCSGCHSENVHMGSLDTGSYEGLKKGGTHGQIIVPGKSAESRLYLMLAGKMSPLMPMDGSKLGQTEVALVARWIDAGAPGPAAGEKVAKGAAVVVKVQPTVAVKPQIFDLAFRPDGKLIALAGFQTVRLYDPLTKAGAGELKGGGDTIRAVAFSPDGTMLAASGGLPGQRGEVLIYDAAQRKLLRTFTGHSDCIYGLAFSPDGKMLATSSYDKLIQLWNVETGAEIRTLKDHIDAVFALAFTPDGKRLVSGSADRSVKVWDVASGERLYTLSDATDGINTVVLDPTGKLVAAGGLDKTIRVWSLGEKSGKLVNSLIAHEDAILKLSWSPDGKTLVSSSADKTIKTFDAADLTERKTIPAQSDWVYALQFAPDGKSFAAGRFDGSLTIYPNVSAGLDVHRAAR